MSHLIIVITHIMEGKGHIWGGGATDLPFFPTSRKLHKFHKQMRICLHAFICSRQFLRLFSERNAVTVSRKIITKTIVEFLQMFAIKGTAMQIVFGSFYLNQRSKCKILKGILCICICLLRI